MTDRVPKCLGLCNKGITLLSRDGNGAVPFRRPVNLKHFVRSWTKAILKWRERIKMACVQVNPFTIDFSAGFGPVKMEFLTRFPPRRGKTWHTLTGGPYSRPREFTILESPVNRITQSAPDRGVSPRPGDPAARESEFVVHDKSIQMAQSRGDRNISDFIGGFLGALCAPLDEDRGGR